MLTTRAPSQQTTIWIGRGTVTVDSEVVEEAVRGMEIAVAVQDVVATVVALTEGIEVTETHRCS